MTPKRNDPARRPPAAGQWLIKHATSDAAKGWEHLCRQIPEAVAALYDRLSEDPRATVNRARQHPLKGTLGVVIVKGVTLQQWQFEITGGGRVWYAPQPMVGRGAPGIVWITLASPGHPGETE